MTSDLRCLAVQQPFAWAICAGAKDIENRSWTIKYRGQMVIVASSKASVIKEYQKAAKPKALNAGHLTISAAIGVVDIVDVVPLSPTLEDNLWAFGPYCWKLENARLFKKPIPCKGKLNLYSPDDDLTKDILKQLPDAMPVSLDGNGKLWIEIIQKMPDNERLDLQLTNYEKLGDWENVLRLAETGTKSFPGDPFYNYRKGLTLTELGRLDDAVTAFSGAIELVPDEPDSYYARAVCLQSLGQFEKANEDFKKVKELDPEFSGENEIPVATEDDEN